MPWTAFWDSNASIRADIEKSVAGRNCRIKEPKVLENPEMPRTAFWDSNGRLQRASFISSNRDRAESPVSMVE